MGDNHVCSLCNENQAGKQHVKIVFENWPHEKTYTYHRKGKEYTRTRKVSTEIITALCMKCLGTPEKWTSLKELEEPELTPFFDYLVKIGKNPTFRSILTEAGALCVTQDCPHRTDPQCKHLLRDDYSLVPGLDEISCAIGHPGATLVPSLKGDKAMPSNPVRGDLFRGIKSFIALSTFAWRNEHGILARVYFTLFFSLPMLISLTVYSLVAYPFWGALKLKERLTIRGARVFSLCRRKA